MYVIGYSVALSVKEDISAGDILFNRQATVYCIHYITILMLLCNDGI